MESTTALGGSLRLDELLAAAHRLASGGRERATFELQARRLPEGTPYLLSYGIASFLAALENFRPAEWFDEAALRTLLGPGVPESATRALRTLQFQGDVDAVPDGTVVFAGEPLVRIRCDAATGLLVRGLARHCFGRLTAVASLAARLSRAAGGKPVFDLGIGHESSDPDLARAAFVGGLAGSGSVGVLAGGGLQPAPIYSLRLLQHLGDLDTVRARLASLARTATVRLDGNDAFESLRDLVGLGVMVHGVLIDAGDLDAVTRVVRAQLDECGWNQTRVYVGGDLDEVDLAAFGGTDAPIDGYYIGAAIDTRSSFQDVVFEMPIVEWEQSELMRPYGRTTPGRVVEGGAKMVYRRRERGRCVSDVVQRADMPPPNGTVPLLVPLWRGGERLVGAPSLAEMQALASAQLDQFDAKVLAGEAVYPVEWVEPEACEPLDGSDLEFLPDDAEPEQQQPAPPAPRPSLMNEVDDSSDFTSFSSAFGDLLAERLEKGDDPQPDSASSAADPLPTDDPMAPERPAPVAQPVTPAPAPRAEPPAAPVLPANEVGGWPESESEATRDEPEQTPPAASEKKAPAEPNFGADASVRRQGDTVLAAAAALKAKRNGASESRPATDVASAPPAAPAEAPSTDSGGSSATRSKADPLLAAAARLRKVKHGDDAPESDSTAVASAEPAPAAPESVTVDDEKRESADPLKAAAARLKALQSPGGAPAPAAQPSASESATPAAAGSDEPPAEGLEANAKKYEEERVTRSKADPLLGAAGRLKALRGDA